MGIADHAEKAENREHFVESFKLKLQNPRKVIFKGAGAGQRHKTTEKRGQMQKEKSFRRI